MADKKQKKVEAKQHENSVELFDEGEKITLHDDKNKPVEFMQIACVDYEGHFYALLRPAETMEGLDEDEVVIFKLVEGKGKNEDDKFVPVESEDLMNAVFGEYLKAAADEYGCSCGCGCPSDCDCGCQEGKECVCEDDCVCDDDCDDTCDCGCNDKK